MDFQTRVKNHLGTYKCNVMGVAEAGIFNYQGKEYYLDYILPLDNKELNIMEKYRQDFFDSKYKNIKFHRYFHHLNSSQAMCINFFYPLIKEKKLEDIIRLIGLNGEVDYENVAFEKESTIEKGNERKTNFDFYIPLKSGKQVFFEIKYTEREFGKALKDNDHSKKYHNTYEPILDKNQAIKEKAKNEEFFLDNYQIMRNLLHIDNDSYVVFVYPEGNKKIRTTALSARDDVLEQQCKNHFILLRWEELTKKLVETVDPSLRDYFEEFWLKYLNY